MERDQEAYNLVQKAEKKLKPGFFGKLTSSSSSRCEESLDLYEKAGNLFKLSKNWLEAGKCFEKCGELEEKLGVEGAGHYQEAAHCYSFIDAKRSSDVMNLALKIYEKQGRFQMAGKLQKQIAEAYEQEYKYDLAIDGYRRAADYFSMESINSKSYENDCLIKVADLMATIDHKETFQEAPKIYEKIAMYRLTVPLLKSNAKELFFKIVILYLCYDDYISADAYLQKYLNEDPTFVDTRESIFLAEAIESVKNCDVNAFKGAVTKLKTYCDIDKLKTNVLFRIMERMTKKDVMDEDDDVL